MLASVYGEGITIIKNAAREPEIVDLQNFLVKMGAKVTGAGESEIVIEGIKQIKKVVSYTIMPDRIEAGTILCAAAITGGKVKINKVIPEHISSIIYKLEKMDCKIIVEKDYIYIEAPKKLKAVDIKTMPYPGFPTDMQSIITSVLTIAKGTSIIVENIFENSININIDGIDIKTLSHEQHLIYIVFHNMKHFLHGGFGIRQVADFSKYIETYNQFINWEKFWSDLKTLNYDTFALNLIDISLKYLGFDYTKAIYPEGVRDFNIIINSKDYYINSDDLINDILNAGVFGGSTKERKHTALMTLNAVEGQNNTNRFKAIFPNVDYLKGSYTYLQKHPILLPIAWTQRILSYLKKNKNNTTSYINTMELGKQRIELLKEYKIIK